MKNKIVAEADMRVTDQEGGGGEGLRDILDARGGTDLLRRGLAAGALLALGMLVACSWLPTGPTTTQTVIVSQNQTPGAQPSASPSPGESCSPTSLNLGSAGDDFTLTAGGTDHVTLVLSYFLGVAELPATCAARLSPTYEASGTSGCTVSGNEVRAGSPGTCSVKARLGSLESNALALTVVP